MPSVKASTMHDADARTPRWTFLTNHAHVLVCLHRDPGVRLRDVATQVGITERAVQRIVRELTSSGVITRERDGRRNVYEIHLDVGLRHPLESHCSIEDLLRMVDTGAAT